MKEFNEEYNKLCAEFLGWKYKPASDKTTKLHFPKGTWEDNSQIGHCAKKGLCFDSDWNWIMEIKQSIQKLKDVYRFAIEDGYVVIDGNIDTGTIYVYHTNSGRLQKGNNYLQSEKEAVVQAIWLFLLWYNKNKQS